MNGTIAGNRGLRQRVARAARWWAALAGGVLPGLAFAPVHATGLVFVGLVPLFWAAYSPPRPGEAPPGFRRQFVIGFVSAAAFFLVLLHWILYLSNEEVTVPGLMIPALLFMAAYLAVFFGLAVALAGWVERRGGLSPVITLPVLWTLFDLLRSLGALAFPWGSLGYALAPHPAALQLSAWTGFWGLTFWVVLVNGLVFGALRAWQEARGARAWRWTLGAGALLAGPWILGLAVLDHAPPLTRDAAAGLRMALLQPNTAREIKWKPGYEGIVVEDLCRRTREAATRDPDLIVWPETAAPVLILWVPELAQEVHQTIAEIRRWVLVGSLDTILRQGGKAEDYNAAFLYDPDGILRQRYYKTRLVPFSEAMPFQKEIPWINALNFGQSDFTAGKEKDLFTLGDYRFSCLICFESIFPELSRRAVAQGAQYLINTTNDFWFGRSAAPAQHAEMAICRAVENRTPLARCANSGISFFVDPWGRVFDATSIFVAAMPVARQAPGRGGSFYTRHGEWFSWSLLILGALITGPTIWTGRRRG